MPQYLNDVRRSIGWAEYTWNPVTGCRHDRDHCSVRDHCYALRMAHRFGKSFKPAFHPERLDAPSKLKKPSRIFVCSAADLFGAWVPDQWILSTLAACEAAPQHRYFFLTKNSKRYKYIPAGCGHFMISDDWPKNVWLGMSAEGGYIRHEMPTHNAFLSLEPLFGAPMLNFTIRHFMKWIIVGAQTQPLKLPHREWVLDIRRQCRENHIPLYEKSSLAKLDLPGGLIQEVPE